jgi:hypothetical protein
MGELANLMRHGFDPMVCYRLSPCRSKNCTWLRRIGSNTKSPSRSANWGCKLLAPHASGPRDVPRCGALNLLQKTPHYKGVGETATTLNAKLLDLPD